MFGGLITNEFIKLFAKKKTFIIWGLFILLCILLVVVSEKGEETYLKYNNPETQVENLKVEIQNQESYLASLKTDNSLTEEDRKIYEEQTNSYLINLKSQLEAAQASLNSSESSDWKETIKQQIKDQETSLATEKDENTKLYQTRELTRLQMHLDNNVPLDDSNYNTGINYYILNITMIATSFLAIGLALFNGDNISNEYNPGTLKFLLVQPVSRIKVLLSKYTVMVISSTVLIMVTQFLFFLGTGLIKGFGSFGRPYLVGIRYEYVYSNGQKIMTEIAGSGHYIPLWQYLLQALALQLLFLIVTVSFILLISTLSKSSVITMTILICAILGFSIVYSLSTSYRKFSPFIFFHYSNIDDILTGNSIIKSGSFFFTWQTVTGMSIVSVLVFLGISLVVFKKRDIQI